MVYENINTLVGQINRVKWKAIPQSANESTNWIVKQARLSVCFDNWVIEPPPQLIIFLEIDCNNEYP